mmetsp:Transcript_21302/g.45521  ORF Transcript_21302/g.45521 Transcript_21302/m.45521 type:complete len:382 (-) Transcript_21302:953-2098(-)
MPRLVQVPHPLVKLDGPDEQVLVRRAVPQPLPQYGRAPLQVPALLLELAVLQPPLARARLQPARLPVVPARVVDRVRPLGHVGQLQVHAPVRRGGQEQLRAGVGVEARQGVLPRGLEGDVLLLAEVTPELLEGLAFRGGLHDEVVRRGAGPGAARAVGALLGVLVLGAAAPVDAAGPRPQGVEVRRLALVPGLAAVPRLLLRMLARAFLSPAVAPARSRNILHRHHRGPPSRLVVIALLAPPFAGLLRTVTLVRRRRARLALLGVSAAALHRRGIQDVAILVGVRRIEPIVHLQRQPLILGRRAVRQPRKRLSQDRGGRGGGGRADGGGRIVAASLLLLPSAEGAARAAVDAPRVAVLSRTRASPFPRGEGALGLLRRRRG